MPEDLIPDQPPSDPHDRFLATIKRRGEPDWDAINFDVLCPCCGYNLRMLPGRRCPECGLEFHWQDVLDQAGWQSDFLFEHHYGLKPVRSWLKTVWRSFRPRRFWPCVSIHHHISAGPLWFMLASAVASAVVMLLGLEAIGSLILAAIDQVIGHPRYHHWAFPGLGIARVCLEFRTTLPIHYPSNWMVDPICMVIVLLTVLALLCSMRETLGRRQIRSIHLLRVIAYIAGPVCILWSLSEFFISSLLVPVTDRTLSLAIGVFGIGLMLAVPIAYLGAGLKQYLRLPRPWFVAVVVVFVASLAAGTAAILLAS